jgi:L-alanine-DL-glutamate epimerase-like enolase superfamily enzyme
MKIVEIRGYHLRAEMPTPVRNSTGSISRRSALVVELVTDDGRSGWGETQRSPSVAWSFLEANLAAHVLGADPFDANTISRRLSSQGDVATMAASAIDIALWDLRGRVEGKSIATLLGGAVRNRVRAYASGPFMSFGEDPYADVLRDAQRYLGDGFTALKVRCGYSPRADAEIMTTLRRELGPDVDLAIDINTGYSRVAAAEVAQRCEEAELRWIEEPIDPFDVAGYEALSRRSRTPIAAGESLWRLRDFDDHLRRSAVAIIQPDIYLCGGMTGAAKVAALAELHAVPLLPHVFGAFINFYASLQLTAVLPGYRLSAERHYPLFEYDRSENPLRTIPSDPPLNHDGTLTIPDGPGIGIEVDASLLEPFTSLRTSLSLRA